MKDCVGKEVKIGDGIATTCQGYADMSICKVLGFSRQKIQLEVIGNRQPGSGRRITKFPEQCAIIDYDHFIEYCLTHESNA